MTRTTAILSVTAQGPSNINPTDNTVNPTDNTAKVSLCSSEWLPAVLLPSAEGEEAWGWSVVVVVVVMVLTVVWALAVRLRRLLAMPHASSTHPSTAPIQEAAVVATTTAVVAATVVQLATSAE